MTEEGSTEGLVQKLAWGTLCSCDFPGGGLWVCPDIRSGSDANFASVSPIPGMWYLLLSVGKSCISCWFSWAPSWVFWPCKGGQQHLLGPVKLEQANNHGFPGKISWASCGSSLPFASQVLLTHSDCWSMLKAFHACSKNIKRAVFGNCSLKHQKKLKTLKST